MAGKNQVTLTFAGDSESLEKSFGSTTAAAKQAEEQFEKTGHGVDGYSDKVKKSSHETEEYASHLDRAGEAGGTAETRFLGLGAGISGLSTIFGSGKKSTEDYAMAFADLGDSVEHTVVPAFQSIQKGGSALIEKLGGIKMAAGLAAGVAGLGALIVAINKADEAANAKNMEEMTERLQAGAFAATDTNKSFIWLADTTGRLDELFGQAKEAGDRQAEQFLELAEAAGVDSDKIADMRSQLETHTEAQEQATEATDDYNRSLETEADRIRDVADAHRAQIDPLFAVVDALQNVDESQRNVDDALDTYNQAVREHGAGSDEAAEAMRNLRSAQDDTVKSAADLEAASSELAAQISEHPATLSNAMLALEQWRQQGIITEDEARRMGIKFQDAANKADDFAGPYHADLNASDHATSVIRPVQSELNNLDGDRADVYVFAHAAGDAVGALLSGHFAGGGVVPQYLASGGLGGPRGTDTVPAWLTPGEMVLNDSQQAELWAMANGRSGGGGPTLNFYGPILGDRREFSRMVREELQRGSFAGMVR